MKKIILLSSFFALSNVALIAQQNFTGGPPANPNAVNNPINRDLTERAWYRGGNLPAAAAGDFNVFGTLWNSPIYTVTNGVLRSKLNGLVSYNVNGIIAPRDGFMLIGRDAPMQSGAGNLYTALGAYSLLHLNGEGTGVQDLGHRSWMKTGITLTGNRDMSYFGLRQIGAAEDRTETVIAWSDNQSGIADEKRKPKKI